MEPKCYSCIHRGSIPGDAHSCCKYPGNKTGLFDLFAQENAANAKKLHIKANAHGIRMGWFCWPVNFDPVWLQHCDGYTPKEKEHEHQ